MGSIPIRITQCGNRTRVVHQPSKLVMRVRFPFSAHFYVRTFLLYFLTITTKKTDMIGKKSRKYGAYYGELHDFKDNKLIVYNGWRNTSEEVEKLYKNGVKEVLFDMEGDDDHSSTMFFETSGTTDFKQLMVLIANFSPDEFSEVTPNHYRMRFD